MKKIIFTGVLFLFALSIAFSQSEVLEVTVHLKDGSTEQGLMYPNENRPWELQKSISIFDESLRDAKKVKKKDKTKYKAKDIKGYEYDGRSFESHKVMLDGRGDHSSTLKALPKFTLIEKVVDGPISIYMGYGYPPGVASGISYEEIYDDLLSNPEYLMVKQPDNKLKSMHSANIEKWIKDSPTVSEKFANGEYGNFKRKKKKKLGNFLKGQIDNERPDVIINVVEDYNRSMSPE